jgi:hypothetical protein
VRRLVVVLLALALGAPSTASAAGHLWLVARAPLPHGWELALQTVSDDNYSEAGRADQASLSAALSFEKRGVEEVHGYREVRVDELSFDDVTGRVRFSSPRDPTLALDLRIEAIGMPSPYLPQVCAGLPMLQVRVALSGSVRLRTRTRYFGTVRVARLSGNLQYSDAPPGSCSVTSDGPPPICPHGRFVGTPDGPPWLAVGWGLPRLYRYATIEVASAGWGHTIVLTLRRSPFSGTDAVVRATLPRRGPLRGSLRLRVRSRRSDPATPPCPGPAVLSAQGTLTARVVAAFRGWGTRTLVLRRADGSLVDR